LATQAVTYVIQRAESLMALFYLLTLYCVIRSDASERRVAWGLAAITCCAIGMHTKEVMVTAPLVVLLYDRTFLAGSFAAALRSRGALYAGLAATWLLLLLLLLLFDSSGMSEGVAWSGFGLSELSAAEYARSQPGVILHYLRLCLWPHPLVFDYGWPVADALGAILWSTALLTALGLATLWALWRVPPLGFLGACFFLVLAPTSSVMPIIDLAFEHRMYLPLAAVVVAGVVAVDAALARASAPTWVGAALLVATAAPLSAATVLRNQDYRSAEVLWRTVVDRAPDNPRGHMTLSVTLKELDRKEEALASLLRAYEILERNPLGYDNPKARVKLAVALIAAGRNDAAEAQLRGALEIDPSDVNALINLGQLLQQRGELEASLDHLRAAVQYGPSDATAHLNLANVLLRIGRRDEALHHFREAARLDPYNPKPLAGAAWILTTHPAPSTRNPAEAVRLAERAEDLSTRGDPTILSTLATAYDAAGHRDRAMRAAERALQSATELGATRDAQRIRAQLERYRADAARSASP
jgi:tetratricopeptide (TPR) repeat protein